MTKKLRQFVKGMGSTIDLGATSSPSITRVGKGLHPGRTCAEALGADWCKVARDFYSAFSDTVKDGSGYGKSE